MSKKTPIVTDDDSMAVDSDGIVISLLICSISKLNTYQILRLIFQGQTAQVIIYVSAVHFASVEKIGQSQTKCMFSVQPPNIF